MSKSLFTATMLLAGIVFLHSYAKTDNGTTATGNPNPTEMLRQLPDSVFTDVKMEDLLRDEVYMKLAADGWSPQEIVAIMNPRKRKTAMLPMPSSGFQPTDEQPAETRCINS